MKPANHISVAQYAARCGVGPQAIYQRINRGQLDGAITRQGGRVWVHPGRADQAYAMRALPCNSRASRMESRLLTLSYGLADELVGQSREYIHVALCRLVDQVLDGYTEPV